MNPVTLERLASNGSDLSRTHRIVNVFFVFKQSGVGPLLAELGRLGFIIEDGGSPHRHDQANYWKVEASIDLVPAIQDVNAMTDRCVKVAHTCDADYDGWFTEVVPS